MRRKVSTKEELFSHGMYPNPRFVHPLVRKRGCVRNSFWRFLCLTLIIVESPAKAKTIGKYLGSDYVVKASMGHLRDLPKKKMSIDIEHDFQPEYVPIEGKDKSSRKSAAKSARAISSISQLTLTAREKPFRGTSRSCSSSRTKIPAA